MKPADYALGTGRSYQAQAKFNAHRYAWQLPAAAQPGSDTWISLIAGAHEVSLPRLLYVLFAKRLLDTIGATLLLIVTAPLFVAIAVLIRLDSSEAVIFRQPRVGQHGRLFTLYKFRTMAHDPDDKIEWSIDKSGRAHHVKRQNDPRVTRPGRWLRRTSLDELPQLINVVRGEMSLVGPRPELVEIVELYEPWQHCRHVVRPGLTGWWQVSGRSDLPTHEKTELDLSYVCRLSFWLDCLIALKTFRVVCKGHGAY